MASLKLKLLIVEDDLPSLELMAQVLTSHDVEVRPVSDSQKADGLVNQERFDGIFLDLGMPNLNGFELARRIRKSSWNKSTPIVIVTGWDQRDTMHEAFSSGATFFLQKPVDKQKLSMLFRTVRGGMLESRRRNTRVPIQTGVVCEVGDRVLRGMTWNLSHGGMQVEVGDLQPEDTVRLSFRLPVSGVSLEVAGTVVWAKEYRQGIQFTNVSTENEQSIRDFIAAVEK